MYGPPAGFYRNKPHVSIDAQFCVGCMECLHACPSSGTLAAMRKGQARAIVTDTELCIGCARCVLICPTHAINMYLVR